VLRGNALILLDYLGLVKKIAEISKESEEYLTRFPVVHLKPGSVTSPFKIKELEGIIKD